MKYAQMFWTPPLRTSKTIDSQDKQIKKSVCLFFCVCAKFLYKLPVLDSVSAFCFLYKLVALNAFYPSFFYSPLFIVSFVFERNHTSSAVTATNNIHFKKKTPRL